MESGDSRCSLFITYKPMLCAFWRTDKKVYLSVFLPLFSPRLALQKEFKILQKFQFKPKTESAFSSLHVKKKKIIGKGGFAPPCRYQISPRPETCIMKLDQHVGSLGLILVLQGNGCDKGGLSASIRGLSDAATGIHTFKRRKLNSLTDATGTNEDYLCTYSHKTGNRDIVVCLRKNRIGGSCTSVFHGYNNHGRRRRLREALLLFTHRKRVARKRHLRYY